MIFFLQHDGWMDDFFLHNFGYMDFLFLHHILDWKDKLLSITLDGLEEFFVDHQLMDGWMDGWVFLHQFGWMNLFSIILDGCSRLPLCVLCSLSLSASAVVSFVCGRSLQWNYILQRLWCKLAEDLPLFIVVCCCFLLPHPAFFSFCSKILICFRFGAAIVGGLFCQFF